MSRVKKNRGTTIEVGDFEAYRDTGCQVHPSCLSCPLPQCIYDTARSQQEYERQVTYAAIRRLRDEGVAPKEIARRTNRSIWLVWRILRESRNEQA